MSTDDADATTVTPQDAVAIAKRAMKRVNDLEDDVKHLETKLESKNQTIDGLRQEINAVRERTNLLQLVEDADQLSPHQRSAALLQHLKQAAEREETRGREPKQSITRDDAEEALHYPDVDRTTLYTDMERAADLVGDDDVAWYSDGVLYLDLDVSQSSTRLEEVL